VLTVLAGAALSPFIAQFARRPIANLSIIGAGLAFAWGALATKLVADAASGQHWLTAGLWAVAAISASIVGLTAEMSALQKRAAILVAPIVFVAQTFVPIMLAPLILHESFLDTPLSGIPLLFCLGVLLAGATTLARSPALLALSGRREREQNQGASVENGSPESLDARSADTTRPSSRVAPAEPLSVKTTTSPARSERDGTSAREPS
jgi:hypothetical protein